LENALLDAAWEELVEGGYGSFTIEAVAERAHTSRPVVYRRWTTREELMLAAIRHQGVGNPGPIPDTGSLRGDVIALVEYGNKHRLGVAAVFSAQLGAYYRETGRTPNDLRLEFLRDRPSAMEVIMQRAIERGEADPEKVTPRLTALPFDLFRHEILMSFTAVPMNVIEEIVDDIFLPLVMR
jgi:AcrR family transcriptional regulator